MSWFRGLFFNTATPQTNHFIVLEQSLKDTSELLEKRIEEVKGLRKHLLYLNNIYLHRNNCRFRIEFDNTKKARLHLITTSFDASWLNVIIYIPHEQMEIAALYASSVDNILAIVDTKLDFAQCDIAVGKFLLQELTAQARALGLTVIRGQFKILPGVDFSDLALFYSKAGFEVTANDDEGIGTLLYRLENYSA
jgi:hypothetical protein